MDLSLFIEKNEDLFENELWAMKILKKLYYVTSSIDNRIDDLTNRIYYSFNGEIDKRYIRDFLERLPGNKSQFIKNNKSNILKMHKRIVSKKINADLKKYFESEEFLERKRKLNAG